MKGEEIIQICKERLNESCKDCPAKASCEKWRQTAKDVEPWEIGLLLNEKEF